jgi:hypothetical protein
MGCNLHGGFSINDWLARLLIFLLARVFAEGARSIKSKICYLAPSESTKYCGLMSLGLR